MARCPGKLLKEKEEEAKALRVLWEGSRPGGEEGSRFPPHLVVGVTFSRETLLKQKALLHTIPFRLEYLEYDLAF